MSDTSARMPNFWWCPTHHLYRGGTERPCVDAVKLGDVAAELEQLRTRLAAQESIIRAWQEYKLRKQAERERNITAFEDALGVPHEGRGYWYERMIEAAARVRAERDEAQEKLAQMHAEIRAVLADFHHCGPRLPMTMLQQIDDIIERGSPTRCVSDTNGDGDCAACAHNPNALCRQPSVTQDGSETEWGWKPDPDKPDQVICAVDEQAARERVAWASYRKLACREVGPWIEVQS